MITTGGTEALGVVGHIRPVFSQGHHVVTDEGLGAEHHGFSAEGTAPLLLLVEAQAGGLEMTPCDGTDRSLMECASPRLPGWVRGTGL